MYQCIFFFNVCALFSGARGSFLALPAVRHAGGGACTLRCKYESRVDSVPDTPSVQVAKPFK